MISGRIGAVFQRQQIAGAAAFQGAGVAEGQLAVGVGVKKQARVQVQAAHPRHVHEAVAVHVFFLLID